MKVIGFNFTKISASKSPEFKRPEISTNIEFTNLEKEKLEMLKDDEAIKINFKFSVNYDKPKDKEKKEAKDSKGDLGSIQFEGLIVLTASKEESKSLTKSWKKKQIAPSVQIPLYNFILNKCSPKAVSLEDELSLPIHLPIPQIKPKQQE